MKSVIFSILVVATMAAIIIFDWTFIVNCLKLSDTCLLWIDGKLAGWLQIIILCLIMNSAMCLPVIMMWDTCKDMKK